MNSSQLMNNIKTKYDEWFQQAGERSPELMNEILAKMVIIQKEENEYLRKILNEISRRA